MRFLHRSRCDQTANYCCTPSGFATSNRDCQKHPEIATVVSPAMAIQSPLPLFAMLSEATEGFSIPVESDPVHRTSNKIRRNLRITVQICRHRKIKRSHSVRHPQPVSRGKVGHTPKGIPWQEKPLWSHYGDQAAVPAPVPSQFRAEYSEPTVEESPL